MIMHEQHAKNRSRVMDEDDEAETETGNPSPKHAKCRGKKAATRSKC